MSDIYLQSDSSFSIDLKEEHLAKTQKLDNEGQSVRLEIQINEGKWSEEDNLRFVTFMHQNHDIFISKYQRKSLKIFKIFSIYLGKRTASQCRSHYQKMMMKHKSIPKLKKYYKNLFGQERYNQEMELILLHFGKRHSQNEQSAIQSERCQIGIQTETYPEIKIQTQSQKCGYMLHYPFIFGYSAYENYFMPPQKMYSQINSTIFDKCNCMLRNSLI